MNLPWNVGPVNIFDFYLIFNANISESNLPLLVLFFGILLVNKRSLTIVLHKIDPNLHIFPDIDCIMMNYGFSIRTLLFCFSCLTGMEHSFGTFEMLKLGIDS